MSLVYLWSIFCWYGHSQASYIILCAVDDYAQKMKQFHEETSSLEAVRCTICQESFTAKAIISILLVSHPCVQQKLRRAGGDYGLLIMPMNHCKVCLYKVK